MKFRKMKFMTAVAALTCAQAMASEVTYTWDAANPVTSLGDDVRIELNDSAVSSMTFANDADRTVRIEGDPVGFAPDAQLVVPNGTAVFASGLLAAGDLTLSTAERKRAWEIASGSLFKDAPTVVFPDADLSEWRVLSAHLNGNFNETAEPYFQTCGDGVLTVQMQKKSGVYTKCVALCLRQSGADVTGELLWAKYVTGDYVGADFSTDFEGVQEGVSGADQRVGCGVTAVRRGFSS